MQTVLVLFKDDGERRDFPLAGEMTTIGRDRSCALRIPKAEVSRQHCVLQHSGGAAEVRDTGSTNGTYVNGVRVEKNPIEAGDELTVGPVTFVVQIDGVPAEVQPPASLGRAAAGSDETGAGAPAALAAAAGIAAVDLDGPDEASSDASASGSIAPLDLSDLEDDDEDDGLDAAPAGGPSNDDDEEADDLIDLSAVDGGADDEGGSGLDLSFLDDDDD